MGQGNRRRDLEPGSRAHRELPDDDRAAYAPAGEVSDWPANPFAGEGNDRWRVYDWTARIDLNLLDGSFALTLRGQGQEPTCTPRAPADVYAEAQHKARKLLAFFGAECDHWKAGDQEHPVQARDLYDALKAAS